MWCLGEKSRKTDVGQIFQVEMAVVHTYFKNREELVETYESGGSCTQGN